MSSNCIRCLIMRPIDKVLSSREPQVMAIINLTDDSFYAPSRALDDGLLRARISEAVGEGASILDLGGYSSRPDAPHIPLEEEWRRVSFGLSVVRDLVPDVAVSIDTFRSEVARRAVEEYGEVIINDITAGEADAAMVDVAARYNLPYVAMHMRGTPQTMQSLTTYEDGVVAEVCRYFVQRTRWLHDRGVERIILDPGFGFAKTTEQNYELLAGLSRICALGYPVLAGLSRKSMIYRPLNLSPLEALNGTTALNWEALRQGASILRVHDVDEAAQVVKLFALYSKNL